MMNEFLLYMLKYGLVFCEEHQTRSGLIQTMTRLPIFPRILLYAIAQTVFGVKIQMRFVNE